MRNIRYSQESVTHLITPTQVMGTDALYDGLWMTNDG
jgi:hypothetical protein